MSFKAVYLQKDESGSFSAALDTLDDSALDGNSLAEGDVLLRVMHSTLNYKDGLAIGNLSPVVRKWPMVAGIDGAGEVLESSDPRWIAGDLAFINGWGLGEAHWGCLAEKARLPGSWLQSVPSTMSTADCMSIGTAGYTAMLCCMALQRNGVRPEDGEILVTGATGGVGTFAISLLSSWGYTVVGSTGKPEEGEFLRALGASSLIARETLSGSGKPLQKERWAGVVDSVGSHSLANACAQTRYGGSVAACGLAQGMDFPATMAPFILRGVSLVGVDSVMCPMERRAEAWSRLAEELDRKKLAQITKTIELDDVIETAGRFGAGKLTGRVVVNI
ncbi:acrylyl-CoA reductase (NADPH) [Paraburkholderia sp. BL6665CI2N2]|uniref:acrylyl-CoA reductase (NADPH) n=1 Tax=Paraburkholderia sp. BL6665CI2N2 TaxID=1938806 RepID=UPI0010658AEF|nr:MDR family oxidoreductase [Paraburkholderia sp. BL6665CI2N2]TDY16839.1 acrylyl-CoA reductase (NADPH) [Paraburkholderia sp. BL6665CI2N2]